MEKPTSKKEVSRCIFVCSSERGVIDLDKTYDDLQRKGEAIFDEHHINHITRPRIASIFFMANTISQYLIMH